MGRINLSRKEALPRDNDSSEDSGGGTDAKTLQFPKIPAQVVRLPGSLHLMSLILG